MIHIIYIFVDNSQISNMLIEFSVENYKSFKELQTLSMVASSLKPNPLYPWLSHNTFPLSDKLEGIKTKAIYGANASGKVILLRHCIILSE